MFKNYRWHILWRVLLLIVTISIGAFLLVRGWFLYEVFTVPVIIFQVLDFYKFHKKAQEEVEQFVESVHYRDFSRYFDVKHAPLELQPLRKGFNEINTTFKVISREKETQYQYLQKILELVDTGILSYEYNSGEIGWMNESFKKLLGIPYLKTIHSLEKRDAHLYKQVLALRPTENKVVDITHDRNSFKLLMTATAFQTSGRIYKLIAFQNVSEALDETESKAWQKLLSVMTHEIMNSVAPISSLAETLKNRLQLSVAGINERPDGLEDLELGIDTIKRRSEGLLKFAETYRNLNKITTPNFKKLYVRDLFENLHQLMQPTLLQKNIELEVILKDPELTVEADSNLVEQVLINLLVNAMEAVKDKTDARIVLSAYATLGNKIVLKVIDNGAGMSPDRKTAKAGLGTSIVEALTAQLGGELAISSSPNGTTIAISKQAPAAVPLRAL